MGISISSGASSWNAEPYKFWWGSNTASPTGSNSEATPQGDHSWRPGRSVGCWVTRLVRYAFRSVGSSTFSEHGPDAALRPRSADFSGSGYRDLARRPKRLQRDSTNCWISVTPDRMDLTDHSEE